LVRRERGYTMMEVVIAMAIFGIALWIVVILTAEMRANEKRYPVNFMENPEVSSVMARIRKDVFDTKYYPSEFQGFEQTPKTLILYTLTQSGFGETVIWDFRTKGDVHRKSFNATQQVADWVAHGLPNFSIDTYELSTGQDAVRVTAVDDNNKLAIDEIFVPRPHD
jgi:prepilin-type N-terminal cleavage/methylation domain-containing protein